MHVKIADLEVRAYHPGVGLARRTPSWGFPTVQGAIVTGDHRFCLVCWSRCMEGFLIRGRDRVLPVWRRFYYLRTPGSGFRAVRGGIDTGDHRFRPPAIRVVDVWKKYDLGMRPNPPPVALALRTPGWVSTRENNAGWYRPGMTMFVPGL